MRRKLKLLLLGSLANVFEWYDYALFGHFALLIGSKFFPEGDGDVALLKSFLVFAVGYVIRPLGGIMFGMIGDRLGRKVALVLSIVCMAFPTMVIGILPTYADVGIASTISIILARIMQGLSMGGALTGSISFTVEHSPKGRHGIVGSLAMAGACMGILSGSVVVSTVKALVSAEQFLLWGWRIPFLLGFCILGVGLYIKKHMSETPMFEEVKQSGSISESPFKTVLKEHWLDMLLTIMLDATGCVAFYIAAVYMLSLFQSRGFSGQYLWYLTVFCNVLMAFVTIGAGWLSDLIGRRKVMVCSALLLMVTAPFIMSSFSGGTSCAILVSQVALSALAAAYLGPEPALLVEFYPANVRSTALAISYNLSASVFAGATPYFVALITHRTGSIANAAWYIEACAVMSLVGLFFFKDRSNRVS